MSAKTALASERERETDIYIERERQTETERDTQRDRTLLRFLARSPCAKLAELCTLEELCSVR